MTNLASHGAGTGWLHLSRSLAETPQLADETPRLTGFMRHRASRVGPVPAADLGPCVPLHDISPYLVCAVVGAEDRGFFRHGGFWWSNTWVEIRAARREKREVRGVSTITQQLARNLYLHPERSMKRKLHEAVIAWRLEGVLRKERILELYLNLIEWGDGIWGVEAAARRYFSRTPADLDPLQAAVLASMIPAPRRPLVDQNAKRALSKQRRLMLHLYGCGIVSRDERNQANQKISYLERAIADGVPALEVLRRSEDLAIEPTLQDRPRITTPGLVADDCGLERSTRLETLVTQANGRPLGPRLPLWWKGELLPEVAESQSNRAVPA